MGDMTGSRDADDRLGRVARVEHGSCLVLVDDDLLSARTPIPVAVGDWVHLSDDPDPVTLGAVDRRTAVTRLDPEGLTQVLAANVDIVFVTAPADRMSLARVEREVVIGWDSGATPVVLLTKADLDDGSLVADLAERVVGVDIIPVSVRSRDGVEPVRLLLQPDRTAVLLGPSGAGKSTLVNHLLGHEATSTGAVRESDHRGRHSTSFRELHPVPGGGFLIDTPGLRSLSLAVDHDSVAATFPDILDLAGNCRFRDCRHVAEPDCAVLAAVEAETLAEARLQSYRKIVRELDYELLRDDPAAAREAQGALKARSKLIRQYRKEHGTR